MTDKYEFPEPDLSNELISLILNDTATRAKISGPKRAMIIVYFEGQECKNFKVSYEKTHSGNDQFAVDCRYALENYKIGDTIPIIVCRIYPTSFTGLMIVKLP